MIIFLIFGGIAVDSANAWRMRAELQYTADAAALAGVVELPTSPATAKSTAISYAEKNMDPSQNGNVLVLADVLVGVWNGNAFTETTVDPNAVLARTRRDETNGNQLKTYFLRLTGMENWNVSAVAIAQRYFPACLQDNAIVAAKVVDFQTQNTLYPGICVHANEHVEVTNWNTWLPGSSVTMQFLEDLASPKGQLDDWEDNPETGEPGTNVGLADALGEEFFYPKIVDQIPGMITSFVDGSDSLNIWPDFIGTGSDGNVLTKVVELGEVDGEMLYSDPIPLSGSELVKSIHADEWNINDYDEGYIYYVSCSKLTDTVTIGATVDNPLKNVAFIADCSVKIGGGGLVYDAVVGSTYDGGNNPQQHTVHLGNNTQLGLNDGCTKGGGVHVLSNASITGPSGNSYYDVQMLAVYNIHVAAKAGGVEGMNVIAGNDIDWASQNSFGPICSGSGHNWQLPYFRLVL